MRIALIVPCANFVERDEPDCCAGRKLPNDCLECAYYEPGLTDQERRRVLGWAVNVAAMQEISDGINDA
jgi:hypothetical protein